MDTLVPATADYFPKFADKVESTGVKAVTEVWRSGRLKFSGDVRLARNSGWEEGFIPAPMMIDKSQSGRAGINPSSQPLFLVRWSTHRFFVCSGDRIFSRGDPSSRILLTTRILLISGLTE